MMYRYIRNCHICRRAKISRDRYNCLLKPLLISSHPWIDITLDFVTGIPSSNGYNYTVLMVVNRLTKKRYHISCMTDENSITAEATTCLLLNNNC